MLALAEDPDRSYQDEFLDNTHFSDSLTPEETQATNLENLHGDDDLGAGIPGADSTGFFTATDEEIMGLTEAKKGRRRKKHRALKIVLFIVILLILLLGAATYLYYVGYGFPTQETVISEFFDTSQSDEDALKYWVKTDDPEKEMEILSTMNSITPISNIEIDYLERSTISTDAIVTATLQEGGGKIRYSVSLSRDMLSWKVNGLSFAFPSAVDLAEATPYINSGNIQGT
jgi:flagellar basal body-associated protein FliL